MEHDIPRIRGSYPRPVDRRRVEVGFIEHVFAAIAIHDFHVIRLRRNIVRPNSRRLTVVQGRIPEKIMPPVIESVWTHVHLVDGVSGIILKNEKDSVRVGLPSACHWSKRRCKSGDYNYQLFHSECLR